MAARKLDYFSTVAAAIVIVPILAIFDSSKDDEARQKIDATSIGLRFEGNGTAPDYFKLLEREGNFLLVGARNYVYNISIEDFNVQTLIYWPSTEQDVELCLMKGKSKEDCQNYIRILAKDNDTAILVCGTNAYKPTCRRYFLKDDDNDYRVESEFSASGITPYDPLHNSTAYYQAGQRQIYAGTVANFAGSDALISRRQIADPTDNIGLRTERSDIKCLNDPNFVSSFADDRHVYFWLRENAVEYMNCGKAVYSRVARVCKNDRGGPRGYSANLWTSFSKARLNCSLPGEFPFYFDEIAATSSLISRPGSSNDDGDDHIVYAVFNTPYSTIGGSAVCAYSMKEIRKIFRDSPFKSQQSPNSNWLPLTRSQIPLSTLADCDVDSKQLNDEAMNFIRRNSLLDAVIPNYFPSPLIVQTGFKRFTQIAVDPHVRAVDRHLYDVLFIATDDGKVLKLVNLAGSNSIVVEIIQIFGRRASVNSMQIFRPADTAAGGRRAKRRPATRRSVDDDDRTQLIVVSGQEVRSLPVYNCDRAPSCKACVKLQDPYCAWDLNEKLCVGSSIGAWASNKLVQNVTTGHSISCYSEEDDPPSFAVVQPATITEQIRTSNNATQNLYKVVTPSCNCQTKFATFVADRNGEPEGSENVALAGAGTIFSATPKVGAPSYYAEHLIAAALATAVVSMIIGLVAGFRLSHCRNRDGTSRFTCGAPCLQRSKSGASSHDSGTSSPSLCPSDVARNLASKRKKNATPRTIKNLNCAPINAYEYEPPHQAANCSRSSSMNTDVTTIRSSSDNDDTLPGGTLIRLNSTTVTAGAVSPAADMELSPDDLKLNLAVPYLSTFAGGDDADVDDAGNNPNTNYSTLPKDYKVKKTYL